MPINKPTKIIRLGLSGSSGKMGLSLKSLIKKSSSFKLSLSANRKNPVELWRAEEIDGVIDFSLPPLFSKSLRWSVKNQKPFVSGTTGLSAAQKQSLKKASLKIPVFYAENMSGGIFLISKWMAELFHSEFEIHIEDIHHKKKKDRPSGTARWIKKSFPPALQKKIQIKSLRKGKEFGTHRIYLKSQEEILLLEHRALNRGLFASGALKALLLILNKKRGLFGAKDLYMSKATKKFKSSFFT